MQSYKGVKGPVRKAVEAVSRDAYERYLKGDTTAVPKWMQITDADNPKQREKKLRALKAFKKKLRCACPAHAASSAAGCCFGFCCQSVEVCLPVIWRGHVWSGLCGALLPGYVPPLVA